MGVVLLPVVATLSINRGRQYTHNTPGRSIRFVSKVGADGVELVRHHAAEVSETDHYSRHDDCGDDGILQCGDRPAIPNNG